MIYRALVFLLLLLIIASGVGIVTRTHAHRQLFFDLVQAEKQRDALEEEFKQLQVEQAVYAESTLIDRMAREKFGMVAPRADEIVVVRR